MWDPGQVGIRGSEAADRAAKEVLGQNPTADLMPFSDLKPLTARFVYQVWQKEWDETVLYLINFTKFYRNFQTICYLFVIKERKHCFT